MRRRSRGLAWLEINLIYQMNKGMKNEPKKLRSRRFNHSIVPVFNHLIFN